MKPYDYMLSIDPGAHAGVALWQNERLIEVQTFNGSGQQWLEKSLNVSRQLENYGITLIGELVHPRIYNNVRVVIEEPGVFQSAGGDVSAKSGAVVKLCVTTGCLIYALRDLLPRYELETVASWKGQMPKPVVEARVRCKLDRTELALLESTKTSHVWDAVGIGLYSLGRMS